MKSSFTLAILLSSLAEGSPVQHDLTERQMFSSPSVQVKNGTINGRYESGLQQDLFLSIPYAQPPVGDLRLRNPRAINTTWTEAYDATQWRNVCPGYGPSSTRNLTQNQPYVLNEDCLTISVIRPSGVSSDAKLPVLGFIYGGGSVQGTANDPRYNGSYIVQRSVELKEPIIFVSMNYRLSAFGFPVGDSAEKAGILNLGLKDQRLALHWVNENIAAFGGNPKEVTIWGQSAGGSSVISQIIAYGGRDDGLVARAVTTSGSGISSSPVSSSGNVGWASLLNVTGCTGQDDLACLRSLPYDTLYAAIPNSTFSGGARPDGDLLQTSALKAFQNNKVLAIPVMFGATQDEATSGIGAPLGVNNGTAFRGVVERFLATSNPSNATIEKALSVFPNNNTRGCPFGTGDGVISSGVQDKRVNWLYTDNIHAGARYFAQKHSARAPAYSFRFNQVPQNQSIELGVSHANELPYTFGVLNRTVRTPLGNREEDLDTSYRMQQYLINFVNSGSPNKGSSPKVNWPQYSSNADYMIFENNNFRVEKDNYREEDISFLIETAMGKDSN